MPKKLIYAARETLEPRVMGAFGAAFQNLSWDGCRLAGAWLGLGLYALLGKRQEIAVSNVRRAFPHLNQAQAAQIARRMAINFGMTFAEFLHLPAASPAEIRAYCDISGLEHIQNGLEAGNGVILLTAHLGNWEVMGARAAQEFPLAVVARPTSNAGVQSFIDQARKSGGLTVVSKFDTGRASLKLLKQNYAVGILPDQHAGVEGALLPFFGHPTRMVSALARLAMISDARVVPAFGVRRKPWLKDGRILATVFPGWNLENPGKDAEKREETVLEGTRRVAGELEKIISAHPDQWLWLHRRWRKEDSA